MDSPAFDPDALARIASVVSADGWAVNEDWAARPLVTALRETMRRRDAAAEFRAAGVGRGDRRAERPEIRGDRSAWLEETALSTPERTLWEALERLRLGLNRTTLLGLFALEAHYAIYPPGAFYRRHRDAFRDDDARVLSWVLYLNADWQARDGGALRIHVSDREPRDVLPVGGTLVCFLSERFEHEVLPATRERLSLTGWFRRRV